MGNTIKKTTTTDTVVPVLFYHGKENWEPERLYEYFPGIDNTIKIFIPDFDIIFTNIIKIPDKKIKNEMFKRDANKVLFLLLKYIFKTDYWTRHLKEILATGQGYFDSEEGTGFLKSIIIYLFSAKEFDIETIISILTIN